MSTEANIDSGFFRGEDKAIVFTIKNTNGAAIDITGWTMSFRMASALWGTAVITKTPTLTTPASGICTVNLASADTSGLTQDGNSTTYYYTLRRTNAGSRTELAFGHIVVQDTFTD